MSTTQVTADALRRTRVLCGSLRDHTGFRDAVASLAAGGRATFDGAWGSSRALLASALLEHAAGPLTIVCPRAKEIDEFCDDLALFSTSAPFRFTAWETAPSERIAHDDVYGERLGTLKWLNREREVGSRDGLEKRAIVTSIQALLQPAPSRETIERSSRCLHVGDRVDVDQLLRWFAEQRFHHTSAVELPGEFSARGGIIDLFAPDWQRPVRIELFDDTIESLRRFEVTTQRSLDTLDEVEVTVLEPTASHGHFCEHLPASGWILLIEPERIAEEGKHYLSLLENLDEVHSVASVLSKMDRFSVATASSLARGELGAVCRLEVESVQRFSGEIGRVREEIDHLGEDHEVFVVSSTEAEIERLTELLRETSLAATGRLQYVIGHLAEGFRLVQERTILVSANELFLRGEVRRIPKRHLGKAIDSWLDLRSGDLVVHLSHGIARYRGVELLDKQGHAEEHLVLEFHGRAKLYVPASKIDLVQKYVGGTKRSPSLAKLGGTSWLRQKRAAETAVQDMAAEMLELQAQRVSRTGIPFAPDGEWQNEFDASFPYPETDDQTLAIRAIKADMETSRPMDRLLCGDVGFGKTEVAMRAAFKAVNSGYQVAILVPTTILAEQHYHTFSERMAEFPIDIARLSRFCSPKEEREIIEGLKRGRIDIVIGTHRLASKDVKFLNLGMVVIDEEQRFGVEVKERLKTLRSSVDVLTMTATPIPRTLHMSLVGVRDISNLETPPEDRLNVETRVTRFDRNHIRHAILRELNRGGQVFFVHNRVNDIEVLAEKLRQTVPEASLRIGHGQMREEELEKVMVDFIAQRFDLLVATTIVESGLDIPNANTIFIDEADRYGLADLHQLRGRVGRYKHRAYCYLLVDPHKHITPNAAKRLHAIEEYSEIGAGFALSMRDLEIRGAGNLLGSQQSGHIATVGYELYCHLLETAVRRLKRLPPRLSVDVDVDVPGAAFLPDDFVDDIRLKIDLYRRLRRATTYEHLHEFKAELQDRFGSLPAPAQRLLDLAELRLDAAVWQISAIYVEGKDLVFKYVDRSRMDQLARKNRRLRVVDESSCYLRIAPHVDDPEVVLKMAKSVLQHG